MATTRTATPMNDRLGPYVFAFAAGAIALATLAQPRKAEGEQSDDAKARAEIANKLFDRLAILYRVPRARPRQLP